MKSKNIYTDKVRLALDFHQKGDYERAKLLYVEALDANAYDAQALQLLGVILFMEEEYEAAIQLIKNSIAIDPTIYEAQNNLGNIYKSLKKYDTAFSYYQNAIELQPKAALAHNNIAIIYKHKKDYKLALNHYKLAIKYQPKYTDAYCNLAKLYYENGSMIEAEKLYYTAIELDPYHHKAYVALAAILYALDKTEQAFEILSKFLQYDSSHYEIQTMLAIYSWIDSDIKGCALNLNQIKRKHFDIHNMEDRFIIAYKEFLEQLIRFKEQYPLLYTVDQNLPILYVIGDSHCLSYSNLKITYNGQMYRTVSKIIIGCKAWHLSVQEENRYKQTFKKIISNLEIDAQVLVVFGEIDCRLDDGILKHYQKQSSALKETIPQFVKNYVYYVSSICHTKSIRPIYSLVPAPLFEKTTTLEKKSELKLVINLFNETIISILEQTQIFDTFCITANELGESNQCYHLDRWHLSPNVMSVLLK